MDVRLKSLDLFVNLQKLFPNYTHLKNASNKYEINIRLKFFSKVFGSQILICSQEYMQKC